MVNVLDGDTIRVILDGSPCKVSLYGIDTPEKRQMHGPQAAHTVTRLINRKKIKLQIYDQDKEDRCLAIVFVGKKNINELLVKRGHAWVHEQYCYEQFCDDWLDYQNRAKSAKKGLWDDPNPVPPWVWRKAPSSMRGEKRGYSPVENGLLSRNGRLTTIMGR